MAAELPRPGVEIIQEFQAASPTVLIPTLVPFVTGPAKEIIEVTTTDGTLNSQAKQGTYGQLPKVISQTSFPSPRNNISEVDVEEPSIRAFFNFGGALKELSRDPGESFLVAQNRAMQPGARSSTFDSSTGLALNGKVLVLAIDVVSRLNTTTDIVVTFAGSGNLTAQQIVDQINAAVGQTVASIIVVGSNNRVAITSTRFGASASVTVRAGGSANTVLGFSSSNETRAEGPGFRAQDQNNNTTLSPWIEWFAGAYLVSGAATSIPAYSDASGSFTPGFGVGFTDTSGTFNASLIDASLAFVGNSSLDLKVGDEFWADGMKPNGTFIMKVEVSRFKLGTVNTKLSTFDSNGKVVTAVYDSSSVNTLFSSAPFAPKYAWFMARNLTGNIAATAATVTGTTTGTAATTATVDAPNVATYPVSLAGLNLQVDVVVDGVTLDTQTFIFTGGPFADLASVVAAVNAIPSQTTGFFAHPDTTLGTKFSLSTDNTGAQQSITIRSTSTALTALGYVAATQYSGTGKDVEFDDVPPALITSAVSLANLATKTLVIKMSTDSDTLSPTYPTTRTHTFGAGPFASLAAACSDINGDGTFVAVDVTTGMGLTAVPSGSNIIIKGTVVGGAAKGLQFDATTSTVDNPTAGMTFTTTVDVGEENLNGQTLKLRLNGRPKVYSIPFTSDSLPDAISAINEAVGFPIASITGAGTNQLTLTSTLKGYASKVEIIVDSWTSGTVPASRKAAAALGFSIAGQVATGTGRPNPDFSLDISGNVTLGAEILRSALTGDPFDPGVSDLYIQYTGLRKDVSPSAKSPALLRISDVATLQTILSPITPANPLGLGMFFMLVNAPGQQCTGLGVDDAPASEPAGTLIGYTKVANFIQSEEIYAIAPLTHDETVAQMFKAHVEFMAGPEQKGERILFFNPLTPTRAVDAIVGSGLGGNTSATPNQFLADVNVTSGITSRGLDPTNLLTSDNVFLEITVDGEVRNYSISAINGVVITLRTTFATGENSDAFFTTTTLNVALVNVDWAIKIRGVELLVPGSTIPDKDKIAETVQAKASAYKERRLYYVFPDKVKATIAGIEELIEGYYACAAIVGMVASQPPQQGFTNFPISGFTGVVGSNDTFSNKQLNVMAGGGTYILVQDAAGAPLISRHQLSTDLTSIEVRELSITKIVDFTAKFLRAGLRNFIGTFNITQPFLDTLSTVTQGLNSFLVESGILLGANLNNLIQSKDAPDTVLVDVTLDVPFPCNFIRLTLVI